jgi:hypothetical protein
VKLSGRAGHFTYRAGDLEQGGPERRVDQILYGSFFAIFRLGEVNVETEQVNRAVAAGHGKLQKPLGPPKVDLGLRLCRDNYLSSRDFTISPRFLCGIGLSRAQSIILDDDRPRQNANQLGFAELASSPNV